MVLVVMAMTAIKYGQVEQFQSQSQLWWRYYSSEDKRSDLTSSSCASGFEYIVMSHSDEL